jgi:hypothetical protein
LRSRLSASRLALKLSISKTINQPNTLFLEDPQTMYERGGEAIRSILNKAIFTKLYVDGSTVVDHQLNEPFDIITDACRAYRTSKTYHRRDAVAPTCNSAALADEYGATDRDTLIDSLSLTLAGHVSSKPVMVGGWADDRTVVTCG